MQEKASMRMDRGSADHNDRSKSTSRENVIDETKTKDNVVIVTTKAGKMMRIPSGEGKLRQKELELYEACYGASLERKNAHYRKKGNKKAIKTIEEDYASKPIKEIIFQIGKGHDHTEEELFDTLNELFGRLMDKYPNLRLFSLSIHLDEGAMHAHVRVAIEHQTEYGDMEINQRAGLEEMGFSEKEPFNVSQYKAEHPDIDFGTKEGKKMLKDAKEAHDRYDNPTIAFTDAMREMWYDVLKDFGYDINRETDPKNKSRRNKTTQEYKQESLVSKNKKLARDIANLEGKKRIYESNVAEYEATKAENDAMKNFLKEYGLLQTYQQSQSFKTSIKKVVLRNEEEEYEI